MRRKTRTKVKKGIIISGITIGVILIIIGIIIAIKLHQQPEISYDDGITCKNYFKQITINLSNKKHNSKIKKCKRNSRQRRRNPNFR